MLNRRLAEMTDCGLIKKSRAGGRGHSHHLTAAGQELKPALIALGGWAMRWARGQMRDQELDVQQLMYDIQRQFDPRRLRLLGRPAYERSISRWLGRHMLAGIRPA